MFTASVQLDQRPIGRSTKDLLEMIYYVHEQIRDVQVNDLVVTIAFESDCEPSITSLARDINDLVRAFNVTFSRDFTETLQESGCNPQFTGNPWAVLRDSGLVTEVEPGVCYLNGELCELVDVIDVFFKRHALAMGATTQSCTSILPINSAARSGYLSNFPQHALFAASAHQTLASLGGIGAVRESVRPISNAQLASPSYLLAPTVCYHFFERLKDRALDGRAMFTAKALCHRNERNSNTLMRLKIFNMREIAFFGDAAYVEETRKSLIDYSSSFLESLGLRYRIATASDPFFASGAEQQRIFQKVSRSKIEIEAFIPYCNAWIAVASFNNHSSALTRKYKIGAPELCSGCFGIGYERLIYSLICQRGPSVRGLVMSLATIKQRLESNG